MNDPLANLKDIHLPAGISWWPPAFGWWLLLAGITITLIAVIALVRYRIRHHAYRKAAQKELATIHQYVTDSGAYVEAVAALVRRTAICAGKNRQAAENIAQLQGEAWQHYLQNHMQPRAAEWIAISRYRPNCIIDRDILFTAVQEWIKGHKA